MNTDESKTTVARRAQAPAPSGEVSTTEGAGTVFKALAVLEAVIGSSPTPTAAAITERLKMPRPTTNRIIANLIKLGFLKRDVTQRQLVEGERLLQLALSVLVRSAQHGPRHEILRALAQRTQETCNVGTIVGGQIRYVDRVESQWPLSLRLDPGSAVPLHCSALGKVLLGHMPAAQRDKYLSTLPLKRYTDNTITQVEVLAKELDLVARRGFSLDNEEYFSGVVGMAVPILNGDDEPVLAVAVAAPSARFTATELEKDLPDLRDAAAKLALCYGRHQIPSSD
jgi:DNA-binding IclR family transcriptional regulator